MRKLKQRREDMKGVRGARRKVKERKREETSREKVKGRYEEEEEGERGIEWICMDIDERKGREEEIVKDVRRGRGARRVQRRGEEVEKERRGRNRK